MRYLDVLNPGVACDRKSIQMERKLLEESEDMVRMTRYNLRPRKLSTGEETEKCKKPAVNIENGGSDQRKTGNDITDTAASDTDTTQEVTIVNNPDNDHVDVRVPTAEPESNKWLPGFTLTELRELQLDDLDIEPVLRCKLNGRPPPVPVASKSREVRHYFLIFDELYIENEILYRKVVINGKCVQQLILPKLLRESAFEFSHVKLGGGHLGSKKTKHKLLQTVYWYGLETDTTLYCRHCDTCEKLKKPEHAPKAPLVMFPVGAPFDRLAVDFLGPLPLTPRGNRNILVVTDHFSKWLEIIPTPDQCADTTARMLLNEVLAKYGYPLEILSDQGRCFESHVFKNLCSMLEIKKLRASIAQPVY